MDKKVIVKLEKFGKNYGEKIVIRNVDLEVYEGEFLTLLGSSGCGKTTILRSISGLDHPSKGRVYIDGEDVTELEPPQRKVNTIFQNYALFPLMTVEENIAFGLKMKKVPKKEIKKKVKKMLELVHLVGYEKRKPKDLSGGEQQRVSIARGLINNPKVLLLDEPLSALDLKLRKQMQIELKQLQRKLGVTFIYVTHDQDEALSMSDRIVVLRKGKIEQIGSPIEVYENPQSLYVADFLGEANVFSGKIIRKEEEKTYVLLNDKDEIEVYTDIKKGKEVDIVVRPENIKISKTKKDINCFKGKVNEQIYDGAFMKNLIDVDGKIVKVVTSGNDRLFNIGDDVYIYWTIEDAIVLESEKNVKR